MGGMTPEEEVAYDRALAHLDAQADLWAVETDLPSMIKNAVNVARLDPAAAADVREKFIDRMEAAIDAIVRQAFIEGAHRGCLGAYDSVRLGYDPESQKREEGGRRRGEKSQDVPR